MTTELERYRRKKGLALVLSGPSGVGKDTLLERLLNRCSSCVRLVTLTTRPQRESEIDGQDYHFVSEAEFDALRDSGGLLESADVYGFSYGSPREFVDRKRGEGIDVILKLDVQGGLSVKRILPEAVMVFLAPPSMEELERRLRNRRSESEEQLQRRLSNALKELDLIPEYDYLIIHGSVDAACEELAAVMVAERARIMTNG